MAFHICCRSVLQFIRVTIVVCIPLLATLSAAIGQEQRLSKKPEKLENVEPTLDERIGIGAAQPSGIALESIVNPEKYIVGPSDVFAVNIWMSPPFSFSLPVTPEGTLIIPTVGEVIVSDLTLAKAKEKILGEARKKYLRVEITATLIKPRPVIVNIVGNVLNPGTYTLNAVDRVHKAIELANTLKRTQPEADLQTVKEDMSTRNIVLRHRDGTQERVDLPKYFAVHDDSWNPYLREGDVIVVPRKPRMKFVFAIYGQVNAPGRYELVRGDSVTDAIKIAHGMTDLAMPERAIFSRLGEDGETISNQTINLFDIMAGKAPDIALEPGDRIIVQRKNDLREDFNVDVKGEVLYPGTYPITNDKTHLSDIIKQAGGFTDHASLGAAYVTRQSVPFENQETERLLSLRGEPASDDSLGYMLATDLRLQHEEISVDFAKLFLQKDSTQDIILHAEDQIIIPSTQKTVYVFGQVASPGHIPFLGGRDAQYYVSKAGGFTDRANRGSLKIIKAKGKQWLSPGETKIEEGDYVWVPSAPDRPFSYYMTITSQAASVISVIIGVAVVVIQVTK
ncbi:MAG: SLBB domain-containing protein [Ignavibacteriae bacterium]|nr:SLBB domain-containing protein [Ignavibacteria bacterium]MBI3364356.1 SLBB domain-containing protein [Ignavibacteriota bacterium]